MYGFSIPLQHSGLPRGRGVWQLATYMKALGAWHPLDLGAATLSAVESSAEASEVAELAAEAAPAGLSVLCAPMLPFALSGKPAEARLGRDGATG
ncbi:unnamed protein product [Effrenium voratum]|nr:unnamed protein product [Effrenium voratum]